VEKRDIDVTRRSVFNVYHDHSNLLESQSIISVHRNDDYSKEKQIVNVGPVLPPSIPDFWVSLL